MRAYLLALLIWLGGIVIFKYQLYPPQLLFWLFLGITNLLLVGFTRKVKEALVFTLIIWFSIFILHLIFYYPLSNLLGSFILSFVFVVIIGKLALSMSPKNILILLGTIFSISIILITFLYFEITNAGKLNPVNTADAAIILGAAVWEGGIPSPSLSARVEAGVNLYKQRKIKKIIVSGGLGRYPPTEGEVMAEVAEKLGVPSKDIIIEKQATSTQENLKYSKYLGRKNNLQSYIIVSDAFHLKRALLMADNLSMDVQGYPALTSPLYTNKWLSFKYTLRECFALLLFYLKNLILSYT